MPICRARHGLAEIDGSRAASFPLEPAFRLQKAASTPLFKGCLLCYLGVVKSTASLGPTRDPDSDKGDPCGLIRATSNCRCLRRAHLIVSSQKSHTPNKGDQEQGTRPCCTDIFKLVERCSWISTKAINPGGGSNLNGSEENSSYHLGGRPSGRDGARQGETDMLPIHTAK